MANHANPSCETCRGRKIFCDKAYPDCLNCVKSKRQCNRNRLRLSWPRHGDKRRAVVCTAPVESQGKKSASLSHHFINVCLADLFNLHLGDNTVLPLQMGNRASQLATPLSFPAPLSLLPEYARVGDRPNLLSYFYNVASAVIPEMEGSRIELLGSIARKSLADDSISTRAVLFSILYLASVYKYGPTIIAARLKNVALRALQVSSQQKQMYPEQVLQHLAANLILCRAEISLTSAATSPWNSHIHSAKAILLYEHNRGAGHLLNVDGAAHVYRCLHYHDILSRLSLRHWQCQEHGGQSKFIAQGGERQFEIQTSLQTLPYSGCLRDEVKMLDDITQYTVSLGNPYRSSREYAQLLLRLELQIKTLHSESKARLTDLGGPECLDEDVSLALSRICRLGSWDAFLRHVHKHLFIIATWIYFERTAQQLTGSSELLSKLLNEAFSLISIHLKAPDVECKTKNSPFSLFIVGIEARNEDERRAMLDIWEQSRRTIEGHIIQCDSVSAIKLGSSVLDMAIHLTKRIWIEDDLHNRPLTHNNYLSKLNRIFSAEEILPALI